MRNNGPELVEPLPAEGCRSDGRARGAIDTPHGEARLVTHRAQSPRVTAAAQPRRRQRHRHRATSRRSPSTCRGTASRVVLLEQPWKVAGRKVATAAADARRRRWSRPPTRCGCGRPLVVGGRSAGARSAARSATALGAVGCLALSFPLHPPGRPEKSRLDELRGAGVPTLVVQGEHDTMGRPEEFPDDLDHVDLVVVPGADHGLKVPKAGRPHPGRGAGDRRRVHAGVAGPRRSSADAGNDRRGRRRSSVGDRACWSRRVAPPSARYLVAPEPLAPRVGWEAMTQNLDDLDDLRALDAATPPRRSTSPPRPPRTAPPASSGTRCRSSTSSTPRPCG